MNRIAARTLIIISAVLNGLSAPGLLMSVFRGPNLQQEFTR